MKGLFLVIILSVQSLPLFCSNGPTIPVESSPFNYSQRDSSGTFSEVKGVEFSISNNSEEPYLTWIDFDISDIQNASLKEKIRSYFLRNKGDFSLFSLYVETVAGFHPDTEPVVGYSFLKRIMPGERFVYVVFGAFDNFLNDHIVVEKESDIIADLRIGPQEYGHFLYSGSSIYVFAKFNGRNRK